MRIRLAFASTLAIGALIVTGCATDTKTAEDQTSAPAESCAFDESVDGVTAVATGGQTPELAVPKGATPPKTLQIIDLCAGEGEEAQADSTVTVDYVGVGYNSGEIFDSSYAKGAPLTFNLGEVIPGWTQGVTGMKPGGARLLLIPADLAYGERGAPPSIEPNEALAFVVELQSIDS